MLLRQYLSVTQHLVIETLILLVNPMFGVFAGLGYITEVCLLLFSSYFPLSFASVKSRFVLVPAHPGNPGQSPEGPVDQSFSPLWAFPCHFMTMSFVITSVSSS